MLEQLRNKVFNRILPPHFSIYDPVTDLVQKAHDKRQTCSLILLSIQEFDQYLNEYPRAQLMKIMSTLEQIMRETIYEYVDRERLIGVKKLQLNIYGIFLSEQPSFSADDTDALAVLIAKSMETDVNFELGGDQISLHLLSGVTQLSPFIDDVQFAIHQATHEAWTHACGTNNIPYNVAKQQIIEIIQQQQISVLAQPIMNLDTGEVFGYEMLCRGPEKSKLNKPEMLFECAERVQLLSELEFVVLHKIFHTIHEQQIRAQVFINVTAVTMAHPYFERNVLRYVKEYGIDASLIIIELTEQHVIRSFSALSELMHRMRSHGFRIALDDTGTGYSNLQSLLEIIPDIIKIDRSLIQEIDRIAAKESLLKALMSFAHEIKCQVVAEGVEREEEAGVLLKHKVEMGQGYYFARPGHLLEKRTSDELKQKIHRLHSSTAS